MIFNGKVRQEHTIWKNYEKLEPRFLALSPPQLKDGPLYEGVYCRGASTDVGLEIAALPRFAASIVIMRFSFY